MGIYTKTGDAGTTSLFTGQRVKKYHPRVETYGTFDELNAVLGLCSHTLSSEQNRQLLKTVQHQIFYFCAELASEPSSNEPSLNKQDEQVQKNEEKRHIRIIELEDVKALESAIDNCMAEVPTTHSFVLPGNCEMASRLHLARTIARRAERRLIELAEQTSIRPLLLQYINRLSDYLYALARYEDHQQHIEHIINTVITRYHAAMLSPTIDNEKNRSSTTDEMASSLASPHHAASSSSEKQPNLNFADIHQIVKQAVIAANAINIAVVIALVDPHGHPIITYSMPNTLLVSNELAPKKAWTAIAMKLATHQLTELVQPNRELYQLETHLEGKIVTFGGGFPLWQKTTQGDVLVGGLGISGGSVAQDMQIAQAAMANLSLHI